MWSGGDGYRKVWNNQVEIMNTSALSYGSLLPVTNCTQSPQVYTIATSKLALQCVAAPLFPPRTDILPCPVIWVPWSTTSVIRLPGWIVELPVRSSSIITDNVITIRSTVQDIGQKTATTTKNATTIVINAGPSSRFKMYVQDDEDETITSTVSIYNKPLTTTRYVQDLNGSENMLLQNSDDEQTIIDKPITLQTQPDNLSEVVNNQAICQLCTDNLDRLPNETLATNLSEQLKINDSLNKLDLIIDAIEILVGNKENQLVDTSQSMTNNHNLSSTTDNSELDIIADSLEYNTDLEMTLKSDTSIDTEIHLPG